MLLAAKVLATTALDLFKDSNILIQMKKEFDTSSKSYVYKSGIQKDRKLPKRIKYEVTLVLSIVGMPTFQSPIIYCIIILLSIRYKDCRHADIFFIYSLLFAK